MTLSYPKITTELPGPKAKRLIGEDERYLSPSYTRVYPLVAARGSGCLIEDVDGNRFLDLTAGIAVTATGHCHPKIVAAIREQAERLLHMSGTDFYYEPQVRLAARLVALAPGTGPKKVFLCNSGTEAIEAAIKLARYHTGRKQIIGFFGAFHGRTCGSLSLTASKRAQREKFFPLLPGIHHAPYPHPDERPDGMSPEEHATQCVDWIRDNLFKAIVPPQEVAAIVVEPIQGEGGYYVPPANFLSELKALCEQHGILFVADEVQTGIGRTGRFFACEHFDVEPDMIAFAKGIASGLPLGGIIARSEVMDWSRGSHASTFGGNPVACAAALATLDLIESGLMANATEQGHYLREKLLRLQNSYRGITDVRGLGLMLAIECEQRDRIIEQAFRRGLLLLPCGSRAIRFCPALTISAEEIDVAIQILEPILAKLLGPKGGKR